MLYLKTTELLEKLESELRLQSLWSSVKPSPEAMSDSSPFSCEAMPFENWVQFIFIPKMKDLIDRGQALPTNIAIAPMAHHVWSSKKNLHTLILIFDNLDTLLSEQR
ncbi:YqcC family protein [Shewanella atlantica]|uniref:YqcC family protein n=1 Tax=Shewanella atlantica TaxID=271099 RepID=A0A3S0RND4_9GAMM|nr:YqcC family protein [Shewanella atlantica]RTR32666.1 YqcC family protein [Shewanella atlantica]